MHFDSNPFLSTPPNPPPSCEMNNSVTLEDMCPLPNTDWLAEISNRYYPQLLSLHANVPLPSICSSCSSGTSKDTRLYTCTDCFNNYAYCQKCMKNNHRYLPFHRIRTWDEQANCFVSARWMDLGMIWNLVHEDGSTCNSQTTSKTLQVLHVNGVHSVQFYSCNCFLNGIKAHTISPTQLLANRLFPSTSCSPTSAFSFEVLELFHNLNLNGFINIKQFCDSVLEMTPWDITYNKEVNGQLIYQRMCS